MDPVPDTLDVAAPAKVNLFLRVLGSRPDGYHDLETAVLPISLADRLEVHAAPLPGGHPPPPPALRLAGEPSALRRVPADGANLVLRAAAALAARTGSRGFAEFVLEKRIPAAAGLGGGSADAAAALMALNRLWRTDLSEDELSAVGAAVGSDVPALLAGGATLATGRGERVERLTLAPLRWVIVPLDLEVRTADAFAWWDRDGAATGPDPVPLLRAAEQGDVWALGRLLFNDLEAPVIRRHPRVRATKEALLAAGAAGAVMCGSGPTVAGLVEPGREVSIPGGIMVSSG